MNGRLSYIRERSAAARFNTQVLKTFGKLNDMDIEDFDGTLARLFVELMRLYN